MKNIITLSIFILVLALRGQSQILWFEDFNDEANGAQTGIAPNNWTVTTTPSGGAASFSKQTHPIYNAEIFQVNQTGTGPTGEGVWNSGPINISTSGQVTIDLNMYTGGATAADYIRCFYSVNGGPEIMFGELYGSGAGVSILTPASAVVTGNTLNIIVRGRENSPGTVTYDGFTGPAAMGFENVSVVKITTLYSRMSGNWDVPATWSLVSHTGASCGCTPNTTTHVIVGGNDVVDMDAVSDAIDVTVLSGSTLRWTADNLALNIHRGGDIRVQGTLNRNSNNGSNISFAYPTIDTIDIAPGGSLTVGHIYANSLSTQLRIFGAGTMGLSGNLRQFSGSSVTNNKTSSALAIGGQQQFIGTSATFTNNGLLTITGDMIATAATNDNNVFTNAGTATIANINPANATFNINNSGTINQSGTFLNIDPTSSFVNLGSGTWNWSSTVAADADMYSVLNTSAAGNTFNYSAAGAQNVFASPTNGVYKTYHHLGMLNSGTKTAAGELDINGNLTIGGTASLASNNNDITLAGNWTASSTNANPFVEGTALVALDGSAQQVISTQNASTTETFNNLTINNSSATVPQILLTSPVTVAATMTMTRGAIYLNSNLFQIGTGFASAAVRGTLVHNRNESSGWFYGGTLRRNFTNTTIADSTSLLGYFPMGTSAAFRPFYLSVTAAPSSGLYFDMLHTGATSYSAASVADAGPTTIIQRRQNSFWQITPSNTGAGGTYSVVMGGTGFGTVQNRDDLRAMKASAVAGSNVTLTGSVTNIRVQRDALTLAQLSATTGLGNTGNQWYIGSTDAINSTLPIKLGGLQARLIEGKVLLTWTTLQEINNEYFTIERTQDFRNYSNVGTVKGSLNSVTELHYSFTDQQPLAGKSYYRLKQTDIDGRATYSDLVTINNDATTGTSLSIYPNPASGSQVTLRINGWQKAETVPVLVYNQQGILVQKTMVAMTAGSTDLQIRFQTALGAGLYTIKTGENLMLTARMLVK